MITKKKRRVLTLGLLLATTFTACKKDEVSGLKPNTSASRSLNDDRQVLSDIQTFYQNMRNIRDGKDPGGNLISIEDAEFLTEASYNYYVARNDYKYATTAVNFSIQEPMSSEGILMKSVTDAFWKIKTNLMNTYNQINFDGKGLALFDLKLSVVDSKTIRFDVYATIKTGPAPSLPVDEIGGMQTVSGAMNHAWFSQSSDPSPTGGNPGSGGQCDLDLLNNAPVANSQNSSLPGAATVLRTLGINNYWNGNQPAIYYGQLIAYQQTISRYDDYTDPGAVIGAPVSDYNQRQIPGYINSRIWSCWMDFSGNPYTIYKYWLTTPNLNFYLGFVPTIIDESKHNLVMPPNSGLSQNSYILDDLGVLAVIPPINSGNGYHLYKITFGVVTGIALPPGGSLANF